MTETKDPYFEERKRILLDKILMEKVDVISAILKLKIFELENMLRWL